VATALGATGVAAATGGVLAEIKNGRNHFARI